MKNNKKEKWHLWVAWHPVLVNTPHGGVRWAWLEPVSRKLCRTGGHNVEYYYKYRTKQAIYNKRSYHDSP